MITLQPLVQENVVIGPVTCNGTEDQLRDCLRGQYNISLTYSAMVAGLSCSMFIYSCSKIMLTEFSFRQAQTAAQKTAAQKTAAQKTTARKTAAQKTAARKTVSAPVFWEPSLGSWWLLW